MDLQISQVIGWLGVPLGAAAFTWLLSTARAPRQVQEVKAEVNLIRKDIAELKAEVADLKELLDSTKEKGNDDLSEFISEWSDKWTEVMRSLGKLEGQLQSLTKHK